MPAWLQFYRVTAMEGPPARRETRRTNKMGGCVFYDPCKSPRVSVYLLFNLDVFCPRQSISALCGLQQRHFSCRADSSNTDYSNQSMRVHDIPRLSRVTGEISRLIIGISLPFRFSFSFLGITSYLPGLFGVSVDQEMSQTCDSAPTMTRLIFLPARQPNVDIELPPPNGRKSELQKTSE